MVDHSVNRWNLQTENGIQGPYSHRELERLVAIGVITDVSLLQDASSGNWLRANHLPSIFTSKPVKSVNERSDRPSIPPPIPNRNSILQLDSPTGKTTSSPTLLTEVKAGRDSLTSPVKLPIIIGSLVILVFFAIVGSAILMVDSEFKGDQTAESAFVGLDKSQLLGTASGFLVSPQIILTNRHVVMQDGLDLTSTGIQFLVSNDTTLAQPVKARVLKISQDEEIDLALLLLDRPVAATPIPIRIEPPKEAEQFILLGYPLANRFELGFELSRLSSAGVVNSISRNQKEFTHDAASNYGNSGGPCIDMKGNALGVLWGGYNIAEKGLGSARYRAVTNIEANKFLHGVSEFEQQPIRTEKQEATEVIGLVGDAVVLITVWSK